MADKNSRIAIKFGGPVQPRKTARDGPPKAGGKRTRTFDEESDDDDYDEGRQEVITGFGVDGAETEAPRRQHRSEKERSPGKEKQQEQKTSKEEARDVTTDQDEVKSMQWGLTLANTSDRDSRDRKSDVRNQGRTPDDEAPEEPQTIEKVALDSLLGKEARSKRRFVIKPAALEGDTNTTSEESTLKDYDATPVEGFGVALLRGLGWDGKDRGPKVKEPKRREAHLALGATRLKEPEDLGQWEQKKKRPRLEEYRREAEKRKKARDERGDYRSERSEGDRRNSDRDGGYGRDRHRDRDRDRDHDRDRDRDYHRRDREGDRDRDRDSRRYRDSRR